MSDATEDTQTSPPPKQNKRRAVRRDMRIISALLNRLGKQWSSDDKIFAAHNLLHWADAILKEESL
ncbi:MAG: hypothetical protein JWM11_3025 [Planctomycetaceae bacterium]|nr:hypothetical protein [Planctomycetaceae bacterium]